MQDYPLSFVKGDPDSVVITLVVPKPLRDSLKHKALHESTTLQAIGYKALRAAALDEPPPNPSVRCIEAIVSYREEIQATYPIGSDIRKQLLALARQMETLILEHKNA